MNLTYNIKSARDITRSEDDHSSYVGTTLAAKTLSARKMKSEVIHIIQTKNTILTSKYGKYKFLLHITTGGPGFYSNFEFKVNPKETNGDTKTITLCFGDSIQISDEVNDTSQLFKEFKRGIQKFSQELKVSNQSLSNSFQIEILNIQTHAVDSKPICNEIGIELVLNHLYREIKLDKRTTFDKVYEEYDTIHLEIGNSNGVLVNNKDIQWEKSFEQINDKIELNHYDQIVNQSLKHFTETNVVNFSNTISNKSYNLNLGLNDKNELKELSMQIGFVLKIDAWNIAYGESIEAITSEGKRLGYTFVNLGKGNYICEELGLIISDSSYLDNKFGNGMLEYVYLTEPKESSR